MREMDDREIENLLRRYRPVAPPADLAGRIAPPRRTWPWAAAAALLLAVTLGARTGVDRVVTQFATVQDPTSQAVTELTQLLGGDPMARQVAELMLAEQ